MPSSAPIRAALPSVLLFSSGIILGAASMAAGVFLSDVRGGDEPTSAASSTLEPVAGLAAAPVAEVSLENRGSPELDSAGDTAGVDTSESAVGPIERALGFAVSVRAGPSYGAGTLVAEGAVLTALHVIEDRQAPEVRFHGGSWAPAVVLATDPDADLALLGVDGQGHPPAPIASALDLSIGDTLLTVGNPRELSFTVHRGAVSYVGRQFGGVRYLQTDLPANPGSSGGPVIDEQGRLVGVMAFILRESEGIAFVTPLDYAAEMLAAADIPLGALRGADAVEAWTDDDAR